MRYLDKYLQYAHQEITFHVSTFDHYVYIPAVYVSCAGDFQFAGPATR